MSKIQALFNKANASNKKKLAVLIDPDKIDEVGMDLLCNRINSAEVDFVFVGGSLLMSSHFDDSIKALKQALNAPAIIFPGHPMQISKEADALLLLSLISGRNPELLIGQHVHAAPILKQSAIEIMSTGYMLVNGGNSTSVSYMSNTQPIPSDKPDIAACTALAGEMLGLKNIYLEAGSGANHAIPLPVIQAVKKQISIPLMVGGGIRSAIAAQEICRAGTDVVVIGSAFEKDSSLMKEISEAIHSLNSPMS